MKWNREPVRIITSVQTLAIAVVTLVALLAAWSSEVTAAVVGIVAAVAVVAGNLVGVRPNVTPYHGPEEPPE